ncbi:MAG: thioredoxin family protein [Epsilonproteobacteria bacterium]|nr:thioredoxin family protein [Campylobacterota bacterium]
MNLEELERVIKEEVGVLLYFSGENCNVCHALRPKFKELFDSKFPKIRQIYIDAHENREISANFRVFSVPTMVIFLDGREFIREGRAVSIHQLEEKLGRVYNILVDS